MNNAYALADLIQQVESIATSLAKIAAHFERLDREAEFRAGCDKLSDALDGCIFREMSR